MRVRRGARGVRAREELIGRHTSWQMQCLERVQADQGGKTGKGKGKDGKGRGKGGGGTQDRWHLSRGVSIQDLDRHPVRRARIDAHKGGVCVRVRLCVTCWCFGHVACELHRSAAGSSTDTVSSTRFKAYNLEGDKFAGGSAESLADLLGSHGVPAIGQL